MSVQLLLAFLHVIIIHRQPADSSESCGYHKIIGEHISRGEDSHFHGKWPWVAFLQHANGTHFCGGALIAPNVVLTAVHCQTPKKVLFGRYYINDRLEGEQEAEVENVIRHPEYINRKDGNNNLIRMEADVALLVLNQSVNYTEYVQPVCLPSDGEDVAANTECVVAGWGMQNRRSGPAYILQEAEVRLGRCADRASVAESVLCTDETAQESVSTCEGDSGGPLVCRRSDVAPWKVFGVVSYGDCGRKSFFMKVPYFSSWIHQRQREIQLLRAPTSEEAKCEAPSRTARVYIIGGWFNWSRELASVEIFDARQNLFLREETAKNLSSARYYLVAAAVGNYVYAIGGYSGTSYSEKTERFDVANPQSAWRNCTPMPTARQTLAAASSPTTIFAIGGYNPQIKRLGYLTTVEAFDTTTQTWNASLPGMPTAREALVAGVIGDFLYAAGGYNKRQLNVVEKYQISTNEWSTVAPMHFRRSDACAAVLDGKFYAIGGDAGSIAHSAAEVYTPSTNTWSRIADMSTRRKRCGAAALGCLIYVFGGYDDNAFLDSVEVYNATTDSWHTLPAKMEVAREGFGIATILDA